MYIYTVTESDLQTRSFTSLGTTLYTSLEDARAAFMDGTPFDEWSDLEAFVERLNRWEPGETWGQHLTEEDRAKVPGFLEGSPSEAYVNETGAFWNDNRLEGVSLSLEIHWVNVH